MFRTPPFRFAPAMTALLLVALPAVAAETSLKIDQDKARITVTADGRPLLVYRFGDVPMKPYVAELYSPGGVQILRDSPHDHKHHHGLMYALTIDNIDFWGEVATSGHEKSRRRSDVGASGQGGAGFTEDLDWVDPRSGKTMAVERRRIEVQRVGPIPATLVTWRMRLATPPEKAEMTITGHHYFGLGLRFVTSMDTGGRFFNASGKPGDVVRGSERLVSAKWSAYAVAKIGVKPVTVAIFDHPQNVRHPARMFTMSPPFAYLAATFNEWKEPLRVERDRPLELCYGVALWDGTLDAAEVEKAYQQWVKTPHISPLPPSGRGAGGEGAGK